MNAQEILAEQAKRASEAYRQGEISKDEAEQIIQSVAQTLMRLSDAS